MKKSLIGILIFTLICVSSVVVFADNIDGHWAKEDYERMEEEGVVIEDTSKASYNPDEFITRGDFIVMLVNLFEPTQMADLSAYEDITPNSPYYEAVSKAVAMGAIKGISATKLGLDLPITREQAMVATNRVLKLKSENPADADKYSDSENISDWAKDAVAAFTELGIVNGYEDGTVRPDGYITKAESTKIINRAVPKIIKEAGEYDLAGVEGCVLVKADNVVLTNADPEQVIVTDKKVQSSLTVDGTPAEKLEEVEVVSELKPEEGTTTPETTEPETTKPEETKTEEKPNKTSSGGGSSSSSSRNDKVAEIIFTETEDAYTITASGDKASNNNTLIVTVVALDGTETTVSKNKLSSAGYANDLAAVAESDALNAEKLVKTLVSSEKYYNNGLARKWGSAVALKFTSAELAAGQPVKDSIPEVYEAIAGVHGEGTAEYIKGLAAEQATVAFTAAEYDDVISTLASL